MALFERHNYPPYPDSPFGVWQREQREYDFLKMQALALAQGGVLKDRTLTPERETIIEKANETKPPTPFKRIKMWPGWRHRRMYGTWRHQFVGRGATSFWMQSCICSKVRLA